MSGVYNLPLIISVTIAMISSGIIITKTGMAIPVAVLGTALAMLGSGLIYTFDLYTGRGKWIGFQIIAGLGWGLSYQIPLIVSHASVGPQDISSVTALILFCINLGGTGFVTAAQSIFANGMISSIPSNAPGVDPTLVIATGATQIRSGAFTSEQVPGIVHSYMDGIHNVFAFGAATVGVALIVSVLNKWKRLNMAGSKGAAGAA
ncbi:Fc.00g046010.m01.CDS01 [Cosmosporella sp. VM-42]